MVRTAAVRGGMKDQGPDALRPFVHAPDVSFLRSPVRSFPTPHDFRARDHTFNDAA